MSCWTMYWITRLDMLHKVGVVVAILALIACIVATVIYLVNRYKEIWHSSEDSKAEYRGYALMARPYMIASYILLPLFISIAALIPDTKSAIAIWAVPKVVNNEQVQQIPENALNLVNAKLKEWVDEVGPKTKKEAD